MLKILRIDPPQEVVGLDGQTSQQSVVTFGEYGRQNLSTMNEQYNVADEIFGRKTSSLSGDNGIPRTHRMPISLLDGKLVMKGKDGVDTELSEGDEIEGHLNRIITPHPEFAQQLPRIYKGKKVYVQEVLSLNEHPDKVIGGWEEYDEPSEEEQISISLRIKQSTHGQNQIAVF